VYVWIVRIHAALCAHAYIHTGKHACTLKTLARREGSKGLRQTDRQTDDRQTDRQTDTDRQTQTDTDRSRQNPLQTWAREAGGRHRGERESVAEIEREGEGGRDNKSSSHRRVSLHTNVHFNSASLRHNTEGIRPA